MLTSSLDQLCAAIPGAGKPLICLEVNPPRGIEFQETFAKLQGHTNGVDFFNVTDCALARVKGAALPFASLLKKEFGIEPLVNMSCRDRNVLSLQADLLGGWMLGVRSIIALTGDAMSVGDNPDRQAVFEVNSVGLLDTVRCLNGGKDLAGNELLGKPTYQPGVVVNPNAKNISAELRRLAKKKAAGACYALSQPVFDREIAKTFFAEAVGCGVPILAGLFPLKSARSVQSICNIPGMKIPDSIAAQSQASGNADLSDFFINHCLELAQAIRGHVAGFHVIAGVTPKLALRFTQFIVENIR